MDEDIVKILKQNVDKARSDALNAFLVVAVPLALVVFILITLLFEVLSVKVSFWIAVFIGIFLFVCFILYVLRSYNSMLKYFSNSTARYQQNLNDKDLIDEWNTTRELLYTEQLTATSVYKTPSYLCVIEGLTQGPFFIKFSEIQNVIIEFSFTRLKMKTLCSFYSMSDGNPLYIVLYSKISEAEHFLESAEFSLLAYFAKVAPLLDIKLQKTVHPKELFQQIKRELVQHQHQL